MFPFNAWFLSCSKEKLSPTDPQNYFDCYSTLDFDSTSLAQYLVGEWKLTDRTCATLIPPPIEAEIILALHDSGTFYFKEDAAVTLEGSWKSKRLMMIFLNLSSITPTVTWKALAYRVRVNCSFMQVAMICVITCLRK